MEIEAEKAVAKNFMFHGGGKCGNPVMIRSLEIMKIQYIVTVPTVWILILEKYLYKIYSQNISRMKVATCGVLCLIYLQKKPYRKWFVTW